MLTSTHPVSKRISILYLLLTFVTGIAIAENSISILNLPDISNWKQKIFSGETQYEVVTLDGKPSVKATSNASASGLVRDIDIDLNKTPYLNWSWRIDNTLTNIDETKKTGDDYAARVYVVISGGLFFWNTRAISYSWTSTKPEGSHWPNAFTENATMISVQSGEQQLGEWVTEKRNVLEDIRNYLHIDATEINAVAIMTDTDNSKQSAVAYYGNISFTEK